MRLVAGACVTERGEMEDSRLVQPNQTAKLVNALLVDQHRRMATFTRTAARFGTLLCALQRGPK